MFILWIKFIIAAAVVAYSGYRICIYAEKIARIVNLSRSFIGLILVAAVTSLPELSVSLSAVRIGALDLALGDLFGSNLFNLAVVGVILIAFIKKPAVLSSGSADLIASSLSILLVALAAMGIIFYNFFNPGPGYSVFCLDVETLLILAIYIFGLYLILRSEKAGGENIGKTGLLSDKHASGVWFKFIVFSVILVGFAIYLSRLGDEIAGIPVAGVALGGTFVGSLFIAITTSLPEVSVAISAAKLGFFDMALGNILGSNMFNMAVVAVADLSLGQKRILSCVSSLHLFTIIFVIISTTLVIAGLSVRSRRQTPGLAWDSAGIIFIYFAANLVNFYLR